MEEETKGFKVKDRRHFGEDGEVRAEDKAEIKEEPAPRPGPSEDDTEKDAGAEFVPEVTFYNFIISLSTTAFFHFGDFAGEEEGKPQKNLPAAKQIIDTISMLRDKTEGNLDANEKNLLDGVLYELRMRYVKEKRNP